MKISRYLDHAVLKPDMTEKEVRDAIQLGIDYDVKTVCVRPCDIELALSMCEGTNTDVICVLDFPHGASGAAEEGGKGGKVAVALVARLQLAWSLPGLRRLGDIRA